MNTASRYAVTLSSRAHRLRAIKIIEAAPPGARVEVKAAKRSMAQNDKLWATLTEVSRQVKWHGQTLKPNDWKLIFLDGLKREVRLVPNLDGNGFVNLGVSSSDLTKSEMSDLIELIHQFGANHGVMFQDDSSTGGTNGEEANNREGEAQEVDAGARRI